MVEDADDRESPVPKVPKGVHGAVVGAFLSSAMLMVDTLCTQSHTIQSGALHVCMKDLRKGYMIVRKGNRGASAVLQH